MGNCHIGKKSVRFAEPPTIAATAAVVGKKEALGPLADYFDIRNDDTTFGQDSWEKAETQMQKLALQKVLEKAGCKEKNLDFAFVGDLLNQCIGSSFSLRNTDIPTFGLYGACSTMAESLLLASMCVAGGFAGTALAMSSSHFASSERQYRFPLGYGGQRTPTAQWTVTGAGAAILKKEGRGPYITSATVGTVVDWGIKDANNMGAAMAPAAYSTIQAHFEDFGRIPADYDLIVTGDLGFLGRQIVTDLFRRDGISVEENYDDCGCMIYARQEQDVHCGGSGCGCSASVLCAYLLRKMQEGRYRKILFCGTGALLSPTSTQQGESVPAVCHAVSISTERNG